MKPQTDLDGSALTMKQRRWRLAQHGAWAAGLFALLALPGGASAQARFVVNGAEVTDTVTGLVWRRCSEGQSWTGNACSRSAAKYSWQGALARAQAAAAGGVPWRLPDVKELASIVDDQRAVPAIDSAIFPNTPIASYWSSTHIAGDGSFAWVVGSTYGDVYPYPRSNSSPIRLVRDSQ